MWASVSLWMLFKQGRETLVQEFNLLQTSRLDLIPISPSAIRSEMARPADLRDILDADIPDEWPPDDWEQHILELLLTTLERDPEQQAYHRYVLLRYGVERRVLIGCLGGFSWPQRPGELEIGYSILPSYRRCGYALEATRCYVRWLLERVRQVDLVAQTFPHIEASVRILVCLGFECTGPGKEEGSLGFRLRAKEAV